MTPAIEMTIEMTIASRGRRMKTDEIIEISRQYGELYFDGPRKYGYGGYRNNAGARVLGISRVEPRSAGGLRVRGVASSGMNAAYGYGQSPDLTWKCSVDYRGAIVGLEVERASTNYGYNGGYGSSYTPWNYDYSQYGYRRY